MRRILALLLLVALPAFADVQTIYLKGYNSPTNPTTFVRDSLVGGNQTFVSGWFQIFGARQVTFHIVSSRNGPADSAVVVGLALDDTTSGTSFTPNNGASNANAQVQVIGTSGVTNFNPAGVRVISITPKADSLGVGTWYIQQKFARITLRTKFPTGTATEPSVSLNTLDSLRIRATIIYDGKAPTQGVYHP